jgi:hypothetical protein
MTSVNISGNKRSRLAMDMPKWYKIPEISMKDYIKCLEPLYSVVEGTHKSTTSVDPFMKAFVIGVNGMDEIEWDAMDKRRLMQKALEMKMGDFHEELMGKFDGYKTLPNGHATGCDVASTDEMTVIEVKNRDNTVKGSDGKHLVAMLKKHTDAGKTAILVQVNCNKDKVNRYGAHESVKVWNGHQAYEFLSGRKNFYSNLLDTVLYTCKHYRTYKSIQESLGKL